MSREHPLAEAFTLTVGLAAALVICVAVFMFFVEIVILLISPETEARIFLRWPAIVNADHSATEVDALQRLLDRLTTHSSRPDAQYRVGILDDAMPNAMALPGGVIVVTRGLLDGVETENELAFLLGHEIAHFENRDHLRQLGRGVALGVLVAAVSGHDGGLVSGNVVTAASLRFAQRQEGAADLAALELVFAEYGHVDRAWRFFERLAARERGFARAGYLSTHPSSGDRAERLRREAERRGWPLTGATRPLDL